MGCLGRATFISSQARLARKEFNVFFLKLETFKVSEDFVLARKEIKFSGVSKLTCAANAGLSKMLSECKSRSPDTWNSCTVSGAPGDC